MTPRLMPHAALTAIIALALGACKTNSSGPPNILYGQDVCADCGMIISDEHFAAAIAETDDGAGPALIFDDIGCMLAYQKEHEVNPKRQRYVHDYASGAWINAESAFLIKSDSIATPMASGLIAFRQRALAQVALRDAAQHPQTYSELLTPPDAERPASTSSKR